MKAVIYARVSSEKQAERGTSIPAQNNKIIIDLINEKDIIQISQLSLVCL